MLSSWWKARSVQRGGYEQTAGIVLGTIIGAAMVAIALAFFLFNAGVIALVRPVPVSDTVRGFFLPVCLVTVVFIALAMLGRRVPRWAGVVLVGLYVLFVTGGYVPIV